MSSTKEKKAKLSAKEERFCYEYILHLNASKAAIAAGYAAKSARITGCRLLTKPNIKSRIAYFKDNLAEASGISALRILKEHEKIAFANAGQIRRSWLTMKEFNSLTEDEKAIIQEITTRTTKHGTELKIKLYDKQRSLDSINQMLGYDAPIKAEITGKDGKDLIPARILTKKEAVELMQKLEDEF